MLDLQLFGIFSPDQGFPKSHFEVIMKPLPRLSLAINKSTMLTQDVPQHVQRARLRSPLPHPQAALCQLVAQYQSWQS